MSVEVYQPPKAEVVLASDIDSWTQIAMHVIRLAKEIADTPFVPDGLRGSVPATAAAILSGRELGLGPMTSLANIHVIKGKPALSAALMRALILAQGHQIETVDISDTRAVVRGRRKGEAVWEEAAFTADQANRAGIVLGGYPQDKLYARATSRLARRRFADVIAGMPYSAEELEDEAGEDGQDVPAAIKPPKPGSPRTAQRRMRTQSPPPAQPHPPAAPAPAPQSAGGALPPLPGEEDAAPAAPDGTAPSGPAAGADPTRAASSAAGRGRSRQETEPPSQSSPAGSASTPDETDYDTPGTATTPQKTAIWTVLSNVYKFGTGEREQARAVCAHIVQRNLASSSDLSKNEAKAVLDTLAHWQHQAAEKGEEPRDYLITVMVAQDAADGGDSGGQ